MALPDAARDNGGTVPIAARNDDSAKTGDTSRLEADIEQLKKDLKKLNETLVGLGREGFDAIQSEGAARLEALRKEADDIAKRLKIKGQNQYDALEAQVQEKPLLSLLAAFGLGLIISRIIDRR
jgi:ElaB/YqjD/DUF883 family membrane-anchored ribosome-binding protein